jgi:hypothetical protein
MLNLQLDKCFYILTEDYTNGRVVEYRLVDTLGKDHYRQYRLLTFFASKRATKAKMPLAKLVLKLPYPLRFTSGCKQRLTALLYHAGCTCSSACTKAPRTAAQGFSYPNQFYSDYKGL